MDKIERVVLELPENLTLAIDRAVDQDMFTSNRRVFILSAIYEKLKDNSTAPSLHEKLETADSTDHVTRSYSDDHDSGYILPDDRNVPMAVRSQNKTNNAVEIKICKELIKFFRYEDRPVSLSEIKKNFQYLFPCSLIKDQLGVLEEEGVLYRLESSIYCLSR